MEHRLRTLLIASHPIQYAVPVYRAMASHPRLNPLIAYCSLQGAQPGLDTEFGVEVQWDVPLLDGYPWVHVPNRSPQPRFDRFWGLFNPGLWPLIRKGEFEAVVIQLGYVYASFWIALAAAKLVDIPVFFGTDAATLEARSGRRWRPQLKTWLWPKVFQLADIALTPSTAGQRLLQSLGIRPDRIAMTYYVVDNDWWAQKAEHADRGAARRHYGIPERAFVVLCCLKLVPWKRPRDVLRAAATLARRDSA